jgi:hypothetical protein
MLSLRNFHAGAGRVRTASTPLHQNTRRRRLRPTHHQREPRDKRKPTPSITSRPATSSTYVGMSECAHGGVAWLGWVGRARAWIINQRRSRLTSISYWCALPHSVRRHETLTGNPPYSNLPYLPDGTGFDPSGLEVNPAESDSAVRYRHGESRAHMGRRVRCWSVVAPFDRGEHIQQRPAIVP